MLLSQQKPIEEILNSLEGEKRYSSWAARGAPRPAEPVEPASPRNEGDPEKNGKTVTGYSVVDFLCQKALVQSRLRGKAKEVKAADSLLVMTCGIGVQAVAGVSAKVTHPACNTISLGGIRGEWQGAERCRECGDCVLDSTGGCP